MLLLGGAKWKKTGWKVEKQSELSEDKQKEQKKNKVFMILLTG